VDLSKYSYCKEHDIEACAIKLDLTALNIYVVTVYRAPCGNFNSFLTGLDSIIKPLYKVELKLILLSALGPGVYSPSNRNEYQGKADNSHLWAYCVDSVGSLTSHNPIGLQGLLWG
jgi:hypothetical protein